MLGRAEVDGDEGQPDHACCVHGKPDELGLVECFWNFPSQNGVKRANYNQEDRVGECNHVTGIDGSL